MNWSFSGPPKSSRKILTFSMIKTNILYHLFLSFMLNLLSLPFACYARLWTWECSLHSTFYMSIVFALITLFARYARLRIRALSLYFLGWEDLIPSEIKHFLSVFKIQFFTVKGVNFPGFFFKSNSSTFLGYPWHATYDSRLFSPNNYGGNFWAPI